MSKTAGSAAEHPGKRSSRRSKKQSQPRVQQPTEVAAPVEAVPDNPGLSKVPNVDDLVTLLMQLEPSDLAGFERLHGMLQCISQGESVSETVRSQLTDAIKQVEEFLSGDNPSAEDVLIEISVLLEKAIASIENNPEDSAPAPRTDPPVQPPRPVSTFELDDTESEAVGIPSQAPMPVEAAVEKTSPLASTTELPQPEVVEEYLPQDSDADLIGEFLAESRELLERAEASLLSLESDPEDAEAVNTIFRAFHTMKGTSAFLGLTALSELAHCAESLLSRVRDNEIRCTGGYADLALRSVDMLKSLAQSVQDALGGRPLVRPNGYESLKTLLRDPEAAGISEAAVAGKTAASPMAGILDEPDETESEQPDAHTEASLLTAVAGALGKNVSGTPSGIEGKAATSPSSQARSEKHLDTSVRVSTSRLDRLIDTVGELVIAQSRVAQDTTVLNGGHHELMKKITHAGKIVRELQDLSMSMRMVPLKATFQKMTRLVRDLAQKSGKLVHLVTEDKDTEIDRNMVDIINDLLVHMVRNSVDHGIEHADVRERCGKDRTGTVYLSASHSGGNVVVEIRDDGAGLNRAKIIEKAISKGLIESEKGMSDNEIYNLIFAPGFSTADKVTDVSGRGVGMDVVRKGVESLRGRIDILSEQGKSCTFTVRLPLTLAITDGMLVHVGTERYIIPTANIHLSFRPEPGALSTIAGRGEMVMLRGELMPVFRLNRLFNIRGAVEDPTKGLLVVVSDGDRRCALLVDELLGQQQVVAKSLGDGLGKIQGVSGAAILGDGRVGLILDPAEIVILARHWAPSGARDLDSGQTAA